MLYYISTHPDVEEKVMEELHRVCGDSRSMEDVDLTKLKYLKCVLNETLRLRPPAPVRGRTLNEEDKIGDYVLPKGGHCTYAPYAIHRHKDLWEDPERFDPGRFQDERIKSIPMGGYVPFGAGLRRCIGEHMAINQILMVIGSLLLDYKFTPQPGVLIEDEWALTLSMINGLPMRVVSR